MSHKNRARLSCESLEARDNPSTSPLGVAAGYNVFVVNNDAQQYTDAEGRVAVGGNATFTGYSVGANLQNSNGTQNSLVVGGAINFSNGQVNAGNVVYGTTGNFHSFGVPNGTTSQGAPIDFAAADQQLLQGSAAAAALPANGTAVNQWGGLYLTGTNAGLNVFQVSASTLSSVWGVNVTVPSGSTVLINVTGASARLQYMGINLSGVSSQQVLFNFPTATSLTLQGIGVPGSILAPLAAVNFSNGQVNGTLVAGSLTGGGQANLSPSLVTIPAAAPSSLSGTVVFNTAGVNQYEPTDVGLAGVTVTLTGTDLSGNAVSLTAATDQNGNYTFTGLAAGTYTVTAYTPLGDVAAFSQVGTAGGQSSGISVGSIALGAGVNATGYVFGEGQSHGVFA